MNPAIAVIAPTEPRDFDRTQTVMPENVWSGHELTQRQRLGEFLLVHPPLAFDDYAARPHEPAAEAAK